MRYPNDEVEILNEDGRVIGAKKRGEIDRIRDILHTTSIFVLTPDGRMALAKIPPRPDEPTTLSTGKLSATAATIIRKDQTRDEAALRGLTKELNLPDTQPVFLGENFERLPNNVRRLIASYYVVHAEPLTANPVDVERLEFLTRSQLEEKIQTNRALFTDPFLVCWERYKDVLPF